MAGGRPSKYKPEYAESARKLCLLGATDVEISNFFEVTEQTLNTWKKKHPEFLESLRAGRALADANVGARLYERAIGYSHPDVHVSSYMGDVTLTPIIKHYPPDTQAASMWLRNRRSDLWRDKKDLDVDNRSSDGSMSPPSAIQFVPYDGEGSE